MIENLRNIAIIAHVDHGKTTLVDKLLKLSGTLDRKEAESERVMDSNDQEKSVASPSWRRTPRSSGTATTSTSSTPRSRRLRRRGGARDVDGRLRAAGGRRPGRPHAADPLRDPEGLQGRPASDRGGEQDRPPGARPDWVIDQIFDLFDNLGATDEQLDFPIVYASALNGIAGLDHEKMDDNMDALFQAIIDHVPAPVVDTEGPFQMQISQLDYNSFLGVIGIGRITRGKVKSNTPVVAISDDGSKRNGRILKIMGHHGLQRVEVA